MNGMSQSKVPSYPSCGVHKRVYVEVMGTWVEFLQAFVYRYGLGEDTVCDLCQKEQKEKERKEKFVESVVRSLTALKYPFIKKEKEIEVAVH